MSDLEGKRIRAYQLGEAVGAGGFGTVYHALQDVIDREVAVKVIRERYANQPQFVRRFETEARIIARLEHPHIVPLYDYWREPEGAYLIMRWLQGGSLRDRMKREKFKPDAIAHYLNQISSALALAHKRDIIHRDIKPENILLDEQGNAYLTDFGIAVDLVHNEDVSRENMSYGSPEYVAPEQLIEKKVTPQSDIYSLGIMLFELLTNARPFAGSTQEIVKMQVRNPVPSLKLSRPDLPPEIDTIIWQATAKKPAARYKDVRDLAEAFEKISRNVQARPKRTATVKRQSFGNEDLSTGKMNVPAFGTRDLSTGKIASSDLSTADIQSSTSPETDGLIDYGDVPVGGASGDGHATMDFGDVPADATGGDAYATMDFNNIQNGSERNAHDTMDFGEISGVTEDDFVTDDPGDDSESKDSFATADLSHVMQDNFDKDSFATADLSSVQANLTQDSTSNEDDALDTHESIEDVYATADLSHAQSFAETLGEDQSDILEIQSDAGMKPLLKDQPNPYKGLSAFQEEDADNFYGRETVVKRLVDSFRGNKKRFLGLIGPSGSGKSSLVRAGVIPAMRLGELDGSEQWFITTMVPGNDVFQSLSEALLRVAVNAPSDWGEKIRQKIDGLHSLLSTILPEENAELVLFIDQFEEVFTLTESQKDIQQFLGMLYYALIHKESRLRLIVTLRADYYDRPLYYAEFGELLQQNTEIVLPLSEKDMEAAIRKPIEQNDGIIEERLVVAILDEVRNQPGALPLVQYALTEIYERAKEKQAEGAITLSYDIYRDVGGVTGALAQSADKIYATLSPAEQTLTRQLFMRLIVLGDDSRATRRRMLWSDIVSGIANRESADNIINLFGRNRLLTLDNDPVTRAPTVDIAHEALIEKWGEFQEWINQNRADLQRRQQLTQTVDEWIENKKGEDYLAVGSRLAEFESLFDNNTLVLTPEEQSYLEDSIAYREELERRRRYRMMILASLAGVAVILAILAGFGMVQALEQRNRAEASRAEALANSRLSQSRALALSATNNIDDLDLSLLLSIEALKVETTYEAIDSLLKGIQTPFVDVFLHGHTNVVNSVTYSPDGSMIASAGDDRTIRLWDSETHELVSEIATSHTKKINRIAFSPDGELIASASADETVRLWSVGNGEEVRVLQVDNDNAMDIPVWTLAFSPDGQFLVSGDGDENRGIGGKLIIWAVESGEVVLEIANSHAGIIYDVEYSPDGSFIASGGDDSIIRLWSAETGELLTELAEHSNWVLTLAFSPTDPTLLISSGVEGRIFYWNIQSGSLLGFIPTQHGDWVTDIEFNADGSIIASGSHDSTARIWSVTGQPLGELHGHSDKMRSLAFHPQENRIVSGSADTDLILWELEDLRYPGMLDAEIPIVTEALVANDDRSRMVVYDQRGAIQVLDVATWEVLAHPNENGLSDLTINHDGRFLALGASNNSIRIYDVNNEAVIAELKGHANIISALVFTPDNQQLISADEGGRILRWDLTGLSDDTEPIETNFGEALRSGITSMTISHNGNYLAIGGRDNLIEVWNLSTEEKVATLEGHSNAIDAIVFDQSDDLLISGGRDNSIIIWDFLSDNPIRTRLNGHTDFIFGLDVSPDNQYLASSSNDTTVRLWDLEALQPIGRPLIGHNDRVTGVKFTSNETLLSTGHDSQIIKWDLNVQNWITTACDISNRSLTNFEWTQYIQLGDYQETCG